MAFWIWIIAALLLLALEVAAPGFIMCSLAVGCIAAAAGAAFSLPLIWQVVLCALGMVLGFSVIRPLMQRKKDGMATNAERMIGMPAEVVEAIPAGGIIRCKNSKKNSHNFLYICLSALPDRAGPESG